MFDIAGIGDMPEYRVPSLRLLRKNAGGWHRPEESGSQFVVPSGKINRILKIPNGARVHFFAGSFGDWAAALAGPTRVTYSDISSAMRDIARKRYSEAGIKFLCADAMDVAHQGYWVSFDPFPLSERLPLLFLKAMAHGRGIRIIMSPLITPLHKEYNPSASDEHVKFTVRATGPGQDKSISARLMSVDSTKQGRRMARLDLKVIGLLQTRRKRTIAGLLQKLKEAGFDTDEIALGKSLGRIHAWSDLIESTSKMLHGKPATEMRTVS